jgi:tyrosine-protein phosphatase
VPISPKTKAVSEISRPPSIASSYSSISSANSRRPSTSTSSQFPSSFSAHTRTRTQSRRPAPPPLHLRNSVVQRAKEQTHISQGGNTSLKPGKRSVSSSQVSTPSQTLFVFPPSPTLTTRTPSTMTLTSAATPREQNIPFPALATPRVSTFRGPQGKTRSFIGLGLPPTPTTGFSRVDVRGYVGLQ